MTTDTELFTEYRYAPPNVLAVRWDGTLETARAIVAFFNADPALIHSLNTRDKFSYTLTFRGDNETVSLFFGAVLTTVPVNVGDFIVIEPDNTIHLGSKDDWGYDHQPVKQPPQLPRVPEIDDIAWITHLSRALNAQVPVTLEDDDYSAPEHPPIYQDLTQGAQS